MTGAPGGRCSPTAGCGEHLEHRETRTARSGPGPRRRGGRLIGAEAAHAAPMIRRSSDADASALWHSAGGDRALTPFGARSLALNLDSAGRRRLVGWTRTSARPTAGPGSRRVPEHTLFRGEPPIRRWVCSPVSSPASGGAPRTRPGARGWVKVGWMQQYASHGDPAPGWTIDELDRACHRARTRLPGRDPSLFRLCRQRWRCSHIHSTMPNIWTARVRTINQLA